MKRAKPDHVKKLIELFEQYPDGLNMRQIQTELQTSPVNAQAALDELGAVKAGAKWVLTDDEVALVEVAPGAKADMTVVNENFTTELSGNSGELPEPKQLDQSVFDGLPPEYRWAAISSDGRAHAHKCTPKGATEASWWCVRGCAVYLIGEGYDTTDWQNSLIERETVNPVSEQKQDDATCPSSDRDQPKAKSDYSPVFDNIKGLVLSTIKAHGGATADRVRELTGMHPDDIADAVQFMVDHGQLIGREVYFATVYEVAA